MDDFLIQNSMWVKTRHATPFCVYCKILGMVLVTTVSLIPGHAVSLDPRKN